jgi:nitrite transporter NirC
VGLGIVLIFAIGAPLQAAGFARNLVVVTAGNIAGGALFIALPYWYVAQGQRRMLAVRPVQDEGAAAAAG